MWTLAIFWATVFLAYANGANDNFKGVAMAVSNKITALNPGKGLAANLVTGFLVIFASRMGVAETETHISVGSIFGVAIVSKTAHWKMFSKVLSLPYPSLPLLVA